MSSSSSSMYTVLITIHRAANVPIADFHDLSADPYVLATIDAPSRPQLPEEPQLTWRTPSRHATRDPEWEDRWIVGGIPEDGFFLKMHLIDEDTKDRDDRLGRAEAHFTREMMHEGFEISKQEYKVQKRRGSIMPYLMTYAAGMLPGQRVRKHNRVIISAKVLGKSSNSNDKRPHTVGPNTFTVHFSPLIGSMVNKGNSATKDEPKQETGNVNKSASASTFVACKLQFTGPVPKELHNHYVGYNWFIKMLYNKKGLSGRILFTSLRKQYRTVYSYDKNTLYGCIDATESKIPQSSGNAESSTTPHDTLEDSSRSFAQEFLKMTKYGRGGRLQTYVLTLDAEWRFCETGDEFAIDFLSKHMMHADGQQIVAFAGEFFVRRIAAGSGEGEQERGEGGTMEDDESDEDPAHYELIIDNDSGTYRPAEETLPVFQAWLSDKKRLGALGRVTCMHCFDDKLQELKTQRKELKKKLAGGEMPKRQQAVRAGSSASSLRVDGRKMSSGAVEKIVAEHQKDNEGKLREDGERDDSEKKDEPQQKTDDSEANADNADNADANGNANGTASHLEEKVNDAGDKSENEVQDEQKPTQAHQDSGIHV